MELLMNTSSQVRVPQLSIPTGQRAECILSCVIRKISGGTDLGHRRDAYSTPLQQFRPELMYGASRDS